MAKTIYEMAVDYGKEHQGTVDIEDFEAGATVVLDELKTRLKKYKTNSLGEYFVAYDYVEEIINELKG